MKIHLVSDMHLNEDGSLVSEIYVVPENWTPPVEWQRVGTSLTPSLDATADLLEGAGMVLTNMEIDGNSSGVS